MLVFDDYSRCYDLLYHDKDYEGETLYIQKLIKKYHPEAKTILDMGCGTGKHAKYLYENGYCVHGVDASARMIKIADCHADGESLIFSKGDIRDLNLEKKFDVIISLFHVISYQTTNKDLQKTFAVACKHLEHGGLFIFDCWYGPAVLTERPAVRIKRVEDDAMVVTRLAEPVMHPTENVVDVNYQVFIKNKDDGTYIEFKENHNMRYLFKPEVEVLLDYAGFQLEDFFEFMSGELPGFQSWSLCCVGRKR